MDVGDRGTFVHKELNSAEIRVVCYAQIQAHWDHLKGSSTSIFNEPMAFIWKTFCEQFYAHAQALNRHPGTCKSDEQCSQLWVLLTSGDVSARDRSALVSTIVAAAYTFFQKQIM